MSLVSTYVRMKGLWFKNPVLYLDDFYICFDDDDPVEVVIGQGAGLGTWTLAEFLWPFGIKAKEVGKGRGGQWLFPPHYTKFRPAHSFFIRLLSAPDLSKGLQIEHRGMSQTLPKGDCVFYGWER